MSLLAARAVTLQLVVVLLLARRALVLLNVGARVVLPNRNSQPLPRFRVHLWILDRLRPNQRVVVHALESCDDAHLVADGTPGRIEPHAILRHRSGRLHFEGVVVCPAADGIAEGSRFPDFTADVDATV